jgi:hypothetical protein
MAEAEIRRLLREKLWWLESGGCSVEKNESGLRILCPDGQIHNCEKKRQSVSKLHAGAGPYRCFNESMNSITDGDDQSAPPA